MESVHETKDMAGFVAKHRDAILTSCTYKRRDFDLICIRSRPHEMRPVKQSLREPFDSDPEAGLGSMDRLPVEVLAMVFENLDLQSYFRIRKVNRKARLVATSAVREYEVVATYALEAYRALLRAHLAYRVTLLDLYGILTGEEAERERQEKEREEKKAEKAEKMAEKMAKWSKSLAGGDSGSSEGGEELSVSSSSLSSLSSSSPSSSPSSSSPSSSPSSPLATAPSSVTASSSSSSTSSTSASAALTAAAAALSPYSPAACSCCGKFGGFLFLLTMKRACFSCLERGHPQVQSVQLSAMATAARVKPGKLCQLLDQPVPTDEYKAKHSDHDLQPVPMLRTVPGWYSMEAPGKDCPKKAAAAAAPPKGPKAVFAAAGSSSPCPHSSPPSPKYVVSVEQAVATLAAQGVELDPKAGPLVHAREWNRAYMAAVALPWVRLDGRRNVGLENGLSCKGCQLWYESGYGCQFCSHLSRQQTYTTETFLDHFASCNQAHWVWEECEQGRTGLAQESEFLKNGGTFPKYGSDGLEL